VSMLALTQNSSAAFDLSGRNVTVTSLSGSGNVTSVGGVSYNNGNEAAYYGGANPVSPTASGPATFTIAGSTDATFNGTLGGETAGNAISLVKNGSGNQVLAGATTYRGNTTVLGGSLTLGTLNINPAASTTVAAGAALNAGTLVQASLANAGTTNLTDPGNNIPTITGTGALTVGAAGVLTSGTVTQASLANDGKTSLTGATASNIGSVTGTGSLSVTNVAGSLSASSIVQASLANTGTTTLTGLGSNIGAVTGTGNLSIAAGATAAAGTLAQTNLSIDGKLALGAAAVLGQTDGAATTVPGTLSLGALGLLDIGDGALVIHYSGASPLMAVRSALQAGRGHVGGAADGEWNGTTGITSSVAAQGYIDNGYEIYALAYGQNDQLPLGPLPSIGSQALGMDSLFVMLTRLGDASYNGLVDDDDVTLVGAFYDPFYDPTGPGGPMHWWNGDFSLDGRVDDDDVTILGAFYDPFATPMPMDFLVANYGSSFAQAFELGQQIRQQMVVAGGSGPAVVPEPGSLALLAAGALGLLARRRRG
jgi:autotransporter-associated beta strand protein